MLIIATQKNTRQAPRKVRLVANTVRKLSLKEAFEQLAMIERKASLLLLKVLRQAVANAQHNHNLNFNDLKIKNILVEDGPIYKRFRAVSRGRAHSIQKKTCHVRVILESQEPEIIHGDQKIANKVKVKKDQSAAVKVSKKTPTADQQLAAVKKAAVSIDQLKKAKTLSKKQMTGAKRSTVHTRNLGGHQ